MSLTPTAGTLYECERVIEGSVADASFAIRKIRDERLYRERWSTFDEYCRDRWNWTRRQAYLMIEHANTLDAIEAGGKEDAAGLECKPMVDIRAEPTPRPTSERQTRPLSKLDPGQRAEAWQQAVEVAAEQGKPAPTGKIVGEVVERIKPAPPEPRQRSDHPAKFSRAIVSTITEYLAGVDVRRILDPFAGTGLVHAIADDLGADSVGIEIEAEWAAMHDRTIHGDSTQLTRQMVGTFDCVVTSPAYGNRMADKHDARDGSDRPTYKHRLGRDLDPNNGGGYLWDSDEYRRLHAEVWERCVELLDPGGLFVLNVKDHVRNGEMQYVTDWHLDVLGRLGLRVVALRPVPTAGLGGSAGENAETRRGVEHVIVLRKVTR